MDYYIYENWTAEKKAVIHGGSCKFCNDGKGIHGDKEEGRNGRWHGPFKTYNDALRHASSLRNRVIRNCKFCIP